MKCPFCGHADDRVLDTRVQKDGSIRRRRECLECKARFSTAETIMIAFPFIIKKDGRREPFTKEKMLKGLQAACQKRPISLAQLDAIVERIAAWIVNRGENEIQARLIGKKVMAELKQLDDVAYIRFASVYRNFKDVQEFVETLEDAELLDFVDPASPQLSLTAIVENEKRTDNETDSQTPITRNRPSTPLSN